MHGTRHPELAGVHTSYRELRHDLEPHLDTEERILFPMIRELAVASTISEHARRSLAEPIGELAIEHERVGELLARLRMLTVGYATPDDGCASYRALYDALAALEADTHLHVHKENNVLFPAVLAIEHRIAVAASPPPGIC